MYATLMFNEPNVIPIVGFSWFDQKGKEPYDIYLRYPRPVPRLRLRHRSHRLRAASAEEESW